MKRRYLLIDDNLDFAENVAEILEEAGADVVVAPGAIEAVQLVKQTRFDALVTDMRMPGLSGAQLVHEVRAIDPGVPIVLLSAYSQDAQLQAARDEGLLAVLSKPSQVPRLLELLEVARRDGAVVLVEDDEALAENLGEALASRGITVCPAHSVRDVDNLAVAPFAAVVDMRVPGGPSGAALERVRQRFPAARRLVISAWDEPVGEETLKKPFDTAALLARLESLYAQRPAS